MSDVESWSKRPGSVSSVARTSFLAGLYHSQERELDIEK